MHFSSFSAAASSNPGAFACISLLFSSIEHDVVLVNRACLPLRLDVKMPLVGSLCPSLSLSFKLFAELLLDACIDPLYSSVPHEASSRYPYFYDDFRRLQLLPLIFLSVPATATPSSVWDEGDSDDLSRLFAFVPHDLQTYVALLVNLPKNLLAKAAIIKNTGQVLEQLPRVISSLDSYMESSLQK
ncbi:hypothetical protein KSP39_PZI007891 [Platanthera zijinensis]|uniref:Uncharacterized protein n=1 Tax=Platanthera zijinensis TaxID=2320716 RepID=A0AAP0BNQ7_9ASPA